MLINYWFTSSRDGGGTIGSSFRQAAVTISSDLVSS